MKPKDPNKPRKSAVKSAKPRTSSVAASKAKLATTASVTPIVTKAKTVSRVAPLKIPPILLEGDAPSAPAVSGPGQRYALGPTSATAPGVSSGAELPESYGTRQLFLAARDPHWLYAHWDFSREQLKRYNALSADGHLLLRVYRGAAEGEPQSQVHLHPESRNWFIPVPAAGAKYLAELGYRDAEHKWVSLTRSGATFTPPDNLSEDTSVRFATIPPEVPFGELLAMVKGAVREHLPLVEAMQQMRAQGYRNLPAPEEVQSEWTPDQEKALGEVISIDHVRRIWIGSLEITELIRRQLEEHVSSIAAAQFSRPSSVEAEAAGAPVSVSSPFGGGERQRSFWFNVNAELIIYGATEPDANVTIGDRPIKLRPDGSFSFRFALPDGLYSLPAVAHAADGMETRRAFLEFSRVTSYDGEVGAHAQDQNLKPPLVSTVA
ncbi:MAG TPA: DUF4912 domain-containing protein [Verrucomicrobiae bacterium]|jgi:hypothetical protein|nr:DUF4912 domain-containing protein [Verrucomicrobiae bacterium]